MLYEDIISKCYINIISLVTLLGKKDRYSHSRISISQSVGRERERERERGRERERTINRICPSKHVYYTENTQITLRAILILHL